ncbi:hypothetical protein R1sor_004139 [Riccia sorocarpa]|uniref:Uncharacterized protein n=1 Tax=Riccia sorocarpa TaxID=122646 RepID=A0ABD3H3M7_9MARC
MPSYPRGGTGEGDLPSINIIVIWREVGNGKSIWSLDIIRHGDFTYENLDGDLHADDGASNGGTFKNRRSSMPREASLVELAQSSTVAIERFGTREAKLAKTEEDQPLTSRCTVRELAAEIGKEDSFVRENGWARLVVDLT